jgi:hypothetical protein
MLNAILAISLILNTILLIVFAILYFFEIGPKWVKWIILGLYMIGALSVSVMIMFIIYRNLMKARSLPLSEAKFGGDGYPVWEGKEAKDILLSCPQLWDLIKDKILDQQVQYSINGMQVKSSDFSMMTKYHSKIIDDMYAVLEPKDKTSKICDEKIFISKPFEFTNYPNIDLLKNHLSDLLVNNIINEPNVTLLLPIATYTYPSDLVKRVKESVGMGSLAGHFILVIVKKDSENKMSITVIDSNSKKIYREGELFTLLRETFMTREVSGQDDTFTDVAINVNYTYKNCRSQQTGDFVNCGYYVFKYIYNYLYINCVSPNKEVDICPNTNPARSFGQMAFGQLKRMAARTTTDPRSDYYRNSELGIADLSPEERSSLSDMKKSSLESKRTPEQLAELKSLEESQQIDIPEVDGGWGLVGDMDM